MSDFLVNVGKLFEERIIEGFQQPFIPPLETIKVNNNNSKASEKIELICNRFHQVGEKTQSRYKDRPTLKINDEYDVQDLFHLLLTLYFDDIRKEEYIPSSFGGNSRSDFLLKSEEIIVEIKNTREGLKDKKVGEQLAIDIQRYQSHPNCKTLVCFVYDPEGIIGNPRGLERDLEQFTDKIEVKVLSDLNNNDRVNP